MTTQRRKRQLTPSRQRANYLARQERDFVASLISLRKEAGLTQQDVADKLGVSQQAISKFESMDSSPTLSTALSYAHAVQALVHFEVALDEGRFQEYGEDWIAVEVKSAPSSEPEAEAGKEFVDVTPEHFITPQEAEAFAGILKSDVALAARKQSPTDGFTEQQQRWIHSVMDKALNQVDTLPTFNADSLRTIAAEIPAYTANPQGFVDLPDLLRQAGVCLIYSDFLPGTKMSGVSFQISETPVIGLSGHGQRLDKVLFTLMHEISHILNGDISAEAPAILHGEESSAELIEHLEQAADKLAVELLFGNCTIPTPANPRKANYAWAKKEAEALNVNYIVLVGYLQKQGILNWSQLSSNPPKVIDYMEQWG
ncbi:helix-turn-helix domain-containing protein [Rothia nasimurium]|uniref:helix-turn-helix domain-containing protein n=1 Tax=Rothia nasimurium TaxID=85336 RepID=UPI00361FF26C